MTRIPLLFCTLLLLTPQFPAPADDAAVSLVFAPALSIPLSQDAEAFTLGGGGRLLARMRIAPFLSLDAGVGFGIAPVNVAPDKAAETAVLSLLAPQVGLSANALLGGKLGVGAHVSGGYYFAFLSGVAAEVTSGQNPVLGAGAELSFRVARSLSLGAGAEYRNFFGLYNDLAVSLVTTYHFQSGGSGQPGQKPYRLLKLSEVVLDPVFPVFYKYYDSHSIGRLRVRNEGKIPLERVKVRVFVSQYMDNPSITPEIPFIGGGREEQVELFALFNNRVLEISEGEKVQVNITVESSVAGKDYGNQLVQTLRLYDRNAVSWADDRRAAAFVTTKDPLVLRFAKNVVGLTKDAGIKGLQPNLLAGVALHEALSLYGISYIVDPSTPYADYSQNREAVDYLQFPSQTLAYKAGDCDDLSILYCALLEAVGIQTAFITVPGHIYTAFLLGPREAQLPGAGDLILRGDEAWVPVEATEIEGGFLRAWELGARQWRENEPRGQAGFFPIREAWKLYEPVGFGGEGAAVEPPPAERIVERFRREVERLVDRELYPQEAGLLQQVRQSQEDPRLLNKLGLLYARYGRAEKAAEQFRKILARKEYLPALVNLGNLAFMQKAQDQALAFYERAYRLSSSNSGVLLGLARASHELARFAQAERWYALLKKADPPLAERFSYLEPRASDGAGRASAAESVREVVVWQED